MEYMPIVCSPACKTELQRRHLLYFMGRSYEPPPTTFVGKLTAERPPVDFMPRI